MFLWLLSSPRLTVLKKVAGLSGWDLAVDDLLMDHLSIVTLLSALTMHTGTLIPFRVVHVSGWVNLHLTRFSDLFLPKRVISRTCVLFKNYFIRKLV